MGAIVDRRGEEGPRASLNLAGWMQEGWMQAG